MIRLHRTHTSPVMDPRSPLVSVTTSLLREDHDAFAALAKRAGITKSAYFRKLIEDEIQKAKT